MGKYMDSATDFSHNGETCFLGRPIRRFILLCISVCVFYTLLYFTFLSPHSTRILESRFLLYKPNINFQIPSFPSKSDLKVGGYDALEEFSGRNIEEIILEVSKNIKSLPSSPYILGGTEEGPKFYKNSSCARFPTIYDIEFYSSSGQNLETSNGSLKFYGAYYDNREMNSLGPSINILGVMDRFTSTVITYCQLWFSEENEPIFSRVLEYKPVGSQERSDEKSVDLLTYLLTCQIPESHHKKVPTSVSVVESECDAANNNIRVQYERPQVKERFAVCVKGIDFLTEDFSVRLVEWIELILLLGAHKIFFYEIAAHPNTSKILHHYSSTGQVDVTSLSLPGRKESDTRLRRILSSNKFQQKRMGEDIPYNDCLYRNLYSYDRIAFLNINQIVIPKVAPDWHELMDQVRNSSEGNGAYASYSFRKLSFVDDMTHKNEWLGDIPNYFPMLQHVYHSEEHPKLDENVQCFCNPENMLILHNQTSFECLNGSCTSLSVSNELAQLQHYEPHCDPANQSCLKHNETNAILDTTIWCYLDLVIRRGSRVLEELGFISHIKNI